MDVSSTSITDESSGNKRGQSRDQGRASKVKSPKVNVAYSSFFPLFGIAVTLLVMVAFELVQFSMERTNIVAVKDNQNSAVIESEKVRTQFDSIVKGTVQLATNGNLNAVKIVRQLEQQGVTISRNAGSAP